MQEYTYPDIAKMIDHSLLNPTLTDQDFEEGFRVALDYDVASVCIMPFAYQDAPRLSLEAMSDQALRSASRTEGMQQLSRWQRLDRPSPTVAKNSTW